MQTCRADVPKGCIDLRGLPAPAPLEHALAAVDRMQAGGRLELLTPQMPYPLLELLGDRGYAVAAERRSDGSAHVIVQRPANG